MQSVTCRTCLVGDELRFQPKRGLGGPILTPKWSPKLELRVEALSHVSRGRGPVSGIVLGLNFGHKTCAVFALICANNLAVFWLGGAMSQGFLGDAGARACLKNASVIL